MQPFRFHSIYQPRIWGGQSMRTMLGRELPDRETAYGEAWEISDRPEAMSIVKDGEWEGMSLHRLWEEHRQEIFGPGYERFPRFPLLCKILDARENLSVQVHPPERTAAARQGEVKNEIWYVLHASPDALIYGGMEENATLPDIRHAAETGQMEQLIRSTHLEPGEHLYIPAGLVHAIGAGHLIAEIQQNSDTTYRLYDWNRTDDSGRGRENGLPSRTPPALPSSRSSAVPCSGTGKRPGRENSFCPRQARMPSPPQKQRLFCSQQRFKQTNMTKRAKNSAQC